MRLAIISPLNRSGCSVVTTMLAQCAALTQDLKTVVTYTSRERVLPTYLNLGQYVQDKTRSISQVVKLLQAKAISADELDEFAIKVAPNFYLMDTVSNTITDEEALLVQKYVYTNISADLTLCDISESLDDPNAQELLDASDAICVVLNPDTVSIEAFTVWRESEFWPKDKPFFIVIDRYDEAIIGVRPYAKKCGVEAKNTCKLHYSPFIVKACNENFLAEIVPYAYEKDIRVLNIRTDLYELMTWCMAACGRKVRWEK